MYQKGESVGSAEPSLSGVFFSPFFCLFVFLNPFVDLLSPSTTKSLGNQTVPREFILSYIFVVISVVYMLKIMEKILKNKGEGLH